MRVETDERRSGTSVAEHFLVQPSPMRRRGRSRKKTVPGAGRPPSVALKRLKPDASGTLSPRASRTRPGWARGASKTNGTRDLDDSRQRPMPGKRRTSRIHPLSIAPSSPQSVIVLVGTEHFAHSRMPLKLGHGQRHAQIRLVPRDDVDGLNSDEKFGSDDRRLSSCPAHNDVCRADGLILLRPRVQHCRQQLANNRFHKTPLKSADNLKAPRFTR